MKKRASAVILAGRAHPAGWALINWAFDLGGETVLGRSIRAFDTCPQIGEIILVTGEDCALAQKEAACCRKPVHLVTGGATRAESARRGVAAASGQMVAIHDGARPFVSHAVIQAALAGAEEWGAAIPAVPVKDTVKLGAAGDGRSVPPPVAWSTIPPTAAPCTRCRPPSALTVTPICGWSQQLEEGEVSQVTDDASLFELAGLPVLHDPGGLTPTTRSPPGRTCPLRPAPDKEETPCASVTVMTSTAWWRAGP